MEELGISANAIEVLLDQGGLISLGGELAKYTLQKIHGYTLSKDLQRELDKLHILDADAIEDKLSIFFAHDIDTYKKKNPNKKIVIFLDTYEALWHNNRSEANRLLSPNNSILLKILP